MESNNKQKLLTDLELKMKNDTSLPLKKSANNLVFGDGNLDSKILFIGEGPGYWEDIKGIPFVGNAGAFLNQLLLAIKLKREDVYITNVIHYRPPENRDPLPDEILAFGIYLDQIIEIINPEVIITLGRFSMAKFLPGVNISSVHGKPKDVFWNGHDITVIPMYHPAAGLRSTEVKLKTIEDFKKISDILITINKAEKKASVIKSEQMSLV